MGFWALAILHRLLQTYRRLEVANVCERDDMYRSVLLSFQNFLGVLEQFLQAGHHESRREGEVGGRQNDAPMAVEDLLGCRRFGRMQFFQELRWCHRRYTLAAVGKRGLSNQQ